LPDPDAVRNVLRNNERTLSELIHAQMEEHYQEGQTVYEAKVTKGFTRLRENNYTKPAGERPSELPRARRREAIHSQHSLPAASASACQVQKFDSGPERRFAVLRIC
jgi:type III restriction enzyme